MLGRVLLLCGVMFIAAISAASASPPPDPVGIWLTANGHGAIEIAQCGDALCGRIVGIDRDPGEPMPTDVEGHPQCGLTILRAEKQMEDGRWQGEIIDPRSGSTYRAQLWLDNGKNLHLRGFIGIPLLGATQVWRPFAGRLSADCRLA